MHFTREPTIETIITAKEGYKLVLKPTKASGSEEYFVDMVEVVSFGSSCFYRSFDKPKSFLVPAIDFEILELREPRVVLKSTVIEKEIKIAGGKEGGKETASDKSKRRKGRGKQHKEGAAEETVKPKAVEKREERASLIPPPTTLISENLARFKEMTAIEELALENSPEEPSESGSTTP